MVKLGGQLYVHECVKISLFIGYETCHHMSLLLKRCKHLKLALPVNHHEAPFYYQDSLLLSLLSRHTLFNTTHITNV